MLQWDILHLQVKSHQNIHVSSFIGDAVPFNLFICGTSLMLFRRMRCFEQLSTRPRIQHAPASVLDILGEIRRDLPTVLVRFHWYPLVTFALMLSIGIQCYPFVISLAILIDLPNLRMVAHSLGGVYGIGGSNPFPLLLNTPQILKLGSMSKFGKFVVGQFETVNLLDFEIEKDSFSY